MVTSTSATNCLGVDPEMYESMEERYDKDHGQPMILSWWLHDVYSQYCIRRVQEPLDDANTNSPLNTDFLDYLHLTRITIPPFSCWLQHLPRAQRRFVPFVLAFAAVRILNVPTRLVVYVAFVPLVHRLRPG